MPPSALSQLLQFPKPEEEDEAAPPVAPMKRLVAGVGAGGLPGSPAAGGPMQPGAVGAPKYTGIDDDIQAQVDILKNLQTNRPQANLGDKPQMPQLPQRPQQSAWDLIPQALAGAGDVFSTMGGNYRNGLGAVQGAQKARRDEAYGDQIQRVHNMFQNEREAYTDKLMRYSMELRDHQQRASEAHSLLQTLVEQKYLQGQRTPQDMMDAQKREAYRAQFDKFDFIKDADEHARMLKSTRPEDASIIDQVLQGKKGELQGRPQGMIEYMTNTPSGRGFMESPQGPIKQPGGLKLLSGAEGLQSLKDVAANPDKYYAQSAEAKRQGLTKQEFVQKVKERIKALETGGGKSEKTSDTLEKRSGIADKLQLEMQGGGYGWGQRYDIPQR